MSNKSELIQVLNHLQGEIALNDLHTKSEAELNALIAEIISKNFKGRKLAPNYLESEKFEIKEVIYSETGVFQLFHIISVEDKVHLFTLEEIMDLQETKMCQTIIRAYMFCK